MPPELNTPREELQRSTEELKELHEDIVFDNGSKESAEEIGAEAIDVIIRMIGIASLVGCNVEQTLRKKVDETIYQKYPPTKIQAYMREGMSWHEAMGKAKSVWNTKPTSSL